MNVDGGKAEEGVIEYKGHRSVPFNLNAGELKGRDVSEGLIGSDTIGKLDGPLCELSTARKEWRNLWVNCERKEEGRGKKT